MAKDKAIQKLDDRLYILQERVMALAFILEEALVEIFKVLRDEELLTYDQYAYSRELLRELREVIDKLEKEE